MLFLLDCTLRPVAVVVVVAVVAFVVVVTVVVFGVVVVVVAFCAGGCGIEFGGKGLCLIVVIET